MAKSRLTRLARTLRKQSTDEERLLWRHLRNRRIEWKFRRQVPLGPYIVDFVCFEKKVIVELDGSQHAEPAHRASDATRDAALQNSEFRVLRFWNHEVRDDVDAVLAHIYEVCEGR